MSLQSSEAWHDEVNVRATNIERDFRRAISLVSRGDRSEIVQQTLAVGARNFRAAGWPIPVPWGMSPESWSRLLNEIVKSSTRSDDDVNESSEAGGQPIACANPQSRQEVFAREPVERELA